MNNKKQFISGVLVGIIVVIFVSMFSRSVSILYRNFFPAELAPNKKVSEILQVIDTYYANDYDKDRLKEGMYAGLVEGLGDPYSVYMDKDTFEGFLENTEGTYKGIGVVVSNDKEDNSMLIMMVFDGSPGEAAGILPGDKVRKINGFDISGSTLKVAADMMKGPAGSKVNLTIYRESEKRTFDVDVTRADIDIPTVTHEMINDTVGYIRISTFDRVTYGQYVNAYNDLNGKGMKKLIIDLRNNPGGLLDTVVKITNMLVPEGLITYTENKNGDRRYESSDENCIGIPLVILVNGNSASASEVLTGAVKDLGAGKIVGTTTFGKGVVQNIYKLSDGSGVKVTIAKYYTPSGICIDGTGIIPDYVVEIPEEDVLALSYLGFEEDIQLQKAVEVLGEM